SCNDAVDRGTLAHVLEGKTRIGSPYVITGMAEAAGRGRKRICGWEANGGFLTGSDIQRQGRNLTAPPTRDAGLPILCVLFAAARSNVSLSGLFAGLPARYSCAALLKAFPRAVSQRIVAGFTPADTGQAEDIRTRLQHFFSPACGFSSISGMDCTDG